MKWSDWIKINIIHKYYDSFSIPHHHEAEVQFVVQSATNLNTDQLQKQRLFWEVSYTIIHVREQSLFHNVSGVILNTLLTSKSGWYTTDSVIFIHTFQFR